MKKNLSTQLEVSKLVVILGPTASGKTDLAKKLIAKYSAKGELVSGWNGEVISADSRQIFKYMDIGTGKDKTFPQHMIDIRDPQENYSVAEYQKEVYKIIDNIFSRGKIPFLVGGSMLYIDAVIEGFQFPQQDLSLRLELEKKTTAKIYEELKKVDPISAEKNKLNRRRLVRALEVYLLNSHSQSEYNKKKPNFQYLILGIDLPREELYRRIDKRVDIRIKQGMIEEVENLLKMGITHERLQNFGLEYRHLSNYLQNPTPENLKSEIINLKFKIHAFARRQHTWWRRNKNIYWINSQKQADKLIDQFFNK